MIQIRNFVGKDVEPLRRLWNRAHPTQTMNENLFARKLLLDPNFLPNSMFLACKDDRIVGMAYAPHRLFSISRKDDLEPDRGYITYFAVDPEFSVFEVGTMLLGACESHLIALGKTTITTGYAPIYLNQGFLTTETEYVELFQSFGYSPAESATRNLNLDEATLRTDLDARRASLAAGGIYIGALTPEYIVSYLDEDNTFSNVSWAFEFRTRITSRLDYESVRIAAKDGNVIGACVFGDPNSDAERFGPFGVDRAYRGRGIGTILLDDCLNEMKKRGLKRAWMQWTPIEGAANAVYSRAGFQIIDRLYSFTKQI